MSQDAVDKFFDEFKERFRQLVRMTVAEEIEPLRDMLLRPAGESAQPSVSELVDVTEVAKLLGEDTSTDKARRRAAQKVYDLARRELIPSVRVSPRRVRFDLAAVKRSLAENACYRDILKRYVRPALGSKAPGEIESPDVQELYNSMRARGLSTRMIQYTHAVLRSALKQAVGWQLINLNPADYTKRPKSEADELETAEEGKVKILDAAQAEAFIRAAKSDPMGAALVFALATGVRPEEYLALRWSEVDFDRCEVRIQRVVQWRHMVPVLEAAGMGHSSVAFTQDKYQHVLPSMRKATSNKLEKLLFKNRVVG